MNNSIQISKPALWTGRVLKALLVIFLMVDAIMKVIKHPIYVEKEQPNLVYPKAV